MKVLHVIPGIAPRYGGPSTAIGPMCAALNRLSGVEIELATTDANGSEPPIARAALPAGFVTHLFPRTFSERWKFSFGLWRWLRNHSRDYDLIHVHSVWSFATYAAGSTAARARVPYIVRPAGMLSSYTLNRRVAAKRLYWIACERRTIMRASAFHATSQDEARECQQVRAGAKTVVIPNGVDADAWDVPNDRSALGALCGANAVGRPILLFLSRIHPKKGIADILLPALARSKSNAFLAIVGGADSHAVGYFETVRREIDRLGLVDRVALLGPIAPAKRWHLFDGAAAFVLPSHSENFGIVVAEAMARGCPVVVSDAVQAAEHVHAAGAGKVVGLDVELWAHALSNITSDPEARSRLGEAGRQYARNHFGWDQIAGQILAMYETCLQQADASH